MTWPSVDAPATAPADHGEVRTQAYYAGGGDYFRSGHYSHGMTINSATSTWALAAGTLYYRPFLLPIRRSFDRIGVNVTAAATAASGGVLRFGVYADGGGKPGSLLLDAGTISSESTGAREIVISQSFDPGVLWVALVAQVAGCTITRYNNSLGLPQVSPQTVPAATTTNHCGFEQAGVNGALPASSGTLVLAFAHAGSLRAT